ncbi:MAG: hypothetical protein V1870_02245 [Candidatus Aenigmatarchaeota archaeon]
MNNIGLSRKEMFRYMDRCIELAKETSKDIWYPHVGALVLSTDREIIGEGYKQKLDDTSIVMHAERAALYKAGNKAKGGYLFSVLEPCTKINKSTIFSPCSHLIAEYGIGVVVFGLKDGSRKFNRGSGSKYLQAHGIKVIYLHEYTKTIQKDLFKYLANKKTIAQCRSR